MRIGSLIIIGLSKLKNVMFFEGLIANMISVSQLCDEDLFVKLTKDKFIVLYQDQCQIVKGIRSFYNCYLLTRNNICKIDQSDCHK